LEDVESEEAFGCEVACDVLKPMTLVLAGDEVLGDAEGRGDERELAVDGDVLNVSALESDALLDCGALEPEGGDEMVEHALGDVDAVDLNAGASDGQQDASGAAAHFEDRAAGVTRHPDIKRYVVIVITGGVIRVVIVAAEVVEVFEAHGKKLSAVSTQHSAVAGTVNFT
jgi:hypothetical protein